MINYCILTGRVAKIYDNNNNLRIYIAQNKANGETDFIPLSAFGDNRISFIKKYVKVGDYISVQCNIGIWKKQNGKEELTLYLNNLQWENNVKRGKGELPQGGDMTNDDFTELAQSFIDEPLPFE